MQAEENNMQGVIDYSVDKTKSIVIWEGTHALGSKHNGTIDIIKGEIQTTNDKAFIKGDFEMDMRSIKDLDVVDEKENSKLTQHLKSGDFFDIGKYPKAYLKITDAELIPQNDDSGATHKIKADLTIKGITNPIEFLAIVDFQPDEIIADAEFSIDRTKWDVKFGSTKFPEILGDIIVKDEIDFQIKLFAKLGK